MKKDAGVGADMLRRIHKSSAAGSTAHLNPLQLSPPQTYSMLNPKTRFSDKRTVVLFLSWLSQSAMDLNQMKELTVILTLGFLLQSSELRACSCIGERTVKEEIRASDAVFVGKIVSKELIQVVDSLAINRFNSDTVSKKVLPYNKIIAKFELVVTSHYKGKITSDTLEIYTGLGGGDCGIRFEIGQEYIVYGELEPYLGQSDSDWQYPTGNNVYWTQTCTRTTLINDEELRQIGKFRRKRVTL